MLAKIFTRNRIFSFFVLIFGLILISKLFFLQVLNKNTYRDLADRQYSTPTSDIFERGSILFTRKDGEFISGATQFAGYKVAIDMTKTKDKQVVFEKLNNIKNFSKENFDKINNNDTYEEVLHKLEKKDADKISSLKLKGVSVFKEKWRFYPGDNLASHSIGFVAYDGDDLGGRYGLERYYNTELSRKVENPYVNFFAEVFSNINKHFFTNDLREGDLVSTIEPVVQANLEKELEIVKEKYNPDSIGAIIMNPKDGSIYALSVKPDFDLNNFTKVEDTKTFANPLVENVLEFGSVVKPLVMASAINEGVVKATTTYTDKGSVIIDKKEIFNFDKKGRGPNTSMQDVLNQSLNTGMVFTYQKLGKDKFRDYMLGFGIKNKTGIDLPNETSGLVANLNSPRDLEYANASFGQGIALTPVELVRALASLSNGGVLVTPHLISKIRFNDGTFKELKYETVQTKITKSTSEEISRMLVGVMDKSLRNGELKLDNYSIAIKTGTAQVADLERGGYYEDRNTHSFFGYFPAFEPKFIVFLYAVNPKGVPYASQTWADPFSRISKFLINYYEVPPDR